MGVPLHSTRSDRPLLLLLQHINTPHNATSLSASDPQSDLQRPAHPHIHSKSTSHLLISLVTSYGASLYLELQQPTPAMSYPKGVPDGAFVRFDGWDVPGNDVGQYFTNMDSRARLAALKSAAVEYGARFFAFNTNGWAKCWATIDPKMFVQAKGCSLYIRVEYPGWVFHPRK